MKKILKETFKHWRANEPAREGAVISFYAISSITPFILILTTIIGHLVQNETILAKFYAGLNGIVGANSVSFITSVLSQTKTDSSSVSFVLVSFVTLVLGSLGMFSALKYSLDRIWQSEKSEQKFSFVLSLSHSIKEKLITFSLLPLMAILFVLSFTLTIAINSLGSLGLSLFPVFFSLLTVLDPIFSFAISVILFFLIYQILPARKLPFKELLLGSLVTAILFLFGEFLIGWYLGNIANISIYGAAGSLVALLFFIFYSSQIFFIGASFTYVYSKHYGVLSH